MAYSKICSHQSVLQSRSQKINQQRFVIYEKNESKKKSLGKILTLSEHKSLLPKSQLILPRTSLEDDILSPQANSSPVIVSESLIQPTEQTFSNNVFDAIRNPTFVISRNSSPGKPSELIADLPNRSKESSTESDYDDPSLLIASDNLSNLSESELVDTHEVYLSSVENVCLDYPPVLSLLSKSALSSFPIENDISNFVLTPITNNQVQCSQIRRHKIGMDKNMFPIYQMYLEDPKSNDNCFILASRKRKKSKLCNYLITTNSQDLSREGGGNSGKLRANFLGTDFVIYSDGLGPHSEKVLPDRSNIREELSLIHYEKNIMGLRGPRKMKVVVPNLSNGRRLLANNLINDLVCEDSKLIVQLENKAPEWNDESQTYILNFNGRVTQASVKNFQLIDKVDNRLVLQFGRIGKDLFTLDYSYPLCAVQAFGIALSSFERKFGCE